MRTLHLFIAALALVQCVRYGRSALFFVNPPPLPGAGGGRDRRPYLIGFLVVLLSLVLLLTSVRELLRDGTLG
jgi:hypothetical protein